MFDEAVQSSMADVPQSSLSVAVKDIGEKLKTLEHLKSKPHISIEVKRKRGTKKISYLGNQSGIVYLKHIPVGFIERDMLKYFRQFGNVNRIKLCRSEKTGRIRGFAYIQFEHIEVAKIVAETMNNFVMFNRVLKAQLIPHFYAVKHFSTNICSENYPGKLRKLNNVRSVNRDLSEKAGLKRLSGRLRKLKKMCSKLRTEGINYSYMPHVDLEKVSNASSESTDGKTNATLKHKRIVPKEEYHSSPGPLKPVMEVDESDEEIEFKTPPNVIKKKLLKIGKELQVESASLFSGVLKRNTTPRAKKEQTKQIKNSEKKMKFLKLKPANVNEVSEIKSQKLSKKKILGKVVDKKNVENIEKKLQVETDSVSSGNLKPNSNIKAINDETKLKKNSKKKMKSSKLKPANVNKVLEIKSQKLSKRKILGKVVYGKNVKNIEKKLQVETDSVSSGNSKTSSKCKAMNKETKHANSSIKKVMSLKPVDSNEVSEVKLAKVSKKKILGKIANRKKSGKKEQ